MSSEIEQFQRIVWARLLSAATLEDVTVILSRPRVDSNGTLITDTAIVSAINKALGPLASRNGKSGAVIEVQMPAFATDGGGGQAIQGMLSLPIIVRENPLTNMGATGTHLAAEEICELVMQEINGVSLIAKSATRSSAAVIVLAKNAMQPADGDSIISNGFVITVERKAILGRPARVATPSIAFATGNATLTCGTSGATIRYTLNGEYPGSAAEIPGVETYTTPVAVASGVTITAVASKAGMGDSDLMSYTA